MQPLQTTRHQLSRRAWCWHNWVVSTMHVSKGLRKRQEALWCQEALWKHFLQGAATHYVLPICLLFSLCAFFVQVPTR